jgi:hypothetical protein
MVVGTALVSVLVVAGVITEVLAGRRAPVTIQTWAAQHRYTVEGISRQWFSWQTGRTKRVFKIVMRDPDGHQREGIAIVSGGLGGMASDVVDIRWRP